MIGTVSFRLNTLLGLTFRAAHCEGCYHALIKMRPLYSLSQGSSGGGVRILCGFCFTSTKQADILMGFLVLWLLSQGFQPSQGHGHSGSALRTKELPGVTEQRKERNRRWTLTASQDVTVGSCSPSVSPRKPGIFLLRVYLQAVRPFSIPCRQVQTMPAHPPLRLQRK